MDTVATLPGAERAELFQEAAARKGIRAAVIEKDFWVCWTLGRLFASPRRQPAMLFKGGTSLSKAYHAVERFSEDIDLSLDRHDLGFTGERDPENAKSRKRAEKLLKELAATCAAYLAEAFLPETTRELAEILGAPGAHADGWSLALDEDDPQTVNFRYPRAWADEPGAYLRREVRLEFGARSDFWPATERVIRPYAAEVVPEAFARAENKVDVLEARRTFWEKATLLHAEYHRPDARPSPERLSRHYYDLAQLAQTPIYVDALADLPLLEAVAEHKERFFASSWANYDLARPGTLHLVPHASLRRVLESDYREMREMIFGEPPTFERIVAEVARVEAEVNALAT